MRRAIVFMLTALLLAAGCAADREAVSGASAPSVYPGTRMFRLPTTNATTYSLCAEMDKFGPEIANECARRFVNPVVIVSHANSDTGVWSLHADPARGGVMPVEWFAAEVAARYPDRDIVLWACNPSGARIDVGRVWYFGTSVWCQPDEVVRPRIAAMSYLDRLRLGREVVRDHGVAGSVWEAVTRREP